MDRGNRTEMIELRGRPGTSMVNYSAVQVQEADVNKSMYDPTSAMPILPPSVVQAAIGAQSGSALRQSTISGLGSIHRPQTLTDVTMSASGIRRRRSTRSSEEANATLSRPMTLGSLGRFRYSYKEKGKRGGRWTAMDPSAIPSTSKKGSYDFSVPDEEGRGQASRAASSFPNNPNFSILQHRPLPSHAQETQPALSPSDKDIGLDPVDIEFVTRVDDPVAVKENFDAAMARLARSAKMFGDDGFDSLEWDPDLPRTAGPDTSPEPVAINPQLVYTTVGSVVNPNNQPQFAAPNRIQREGAQRRPLIPMSARQCEAFASRGPPLSLTVANSMHYTQQLTRGSARFRYSPPPQSTRSSLSARSSQQPGPDVESELMNRLTEMVGMVRAQHLLSPTSHAPLDSDDLATKARNNAIIRQNREEDTSSQISSMQNFGNELEKSTLTQGLSNHPNPVQRSARTCYYELSSAPFPNIDDPREALARVEAAYRARKLSLEGMLRRKNENVGLNDPQPGSIHGPQPLAYTATNIQPNPLYEATASAAAYNGRPGVPHPLTAGPPGQRSSRDVAKTLVASRLRLKPHDTRGDITRASPFRYPAPISPRAVQGSIGSVPTPAPYNPYAFNVEYYTTVIFDTLPIDAVEAYYPDKIPNDMTGDFRPLLECIQNQMDMIEIERLSEGEEREQRAKEQEDRFYSGQRSYGMTVDDHINALQAMHNHQATSSDSNASNLYEDNRPLIDKAPISKEGMASLSTAQAASPLIAAAFGTLLAYADSIHSSRGTLSRFVKCPAWMIDSSVEGRKSFLG